MGYRYRPAHPANEDRAYLCYRHARRHPHGHPFSARDLNSQRISPPHPLGLGRERLLLRARPDPCGHARVVHGISFRFLCGSSGLHAGFFADQGGMVRLPGTTIDEYVFWPSDISTVSLYPVKKIDETISMKASNKYCDNRIFHSPPFLMDYKTRRILTLTCVPIVVQCRSDD